MKRSLSIIGLVFALVGMLAGTALAGPQYAFLCDPFDEDDCRGSALVFEFSRPDLKVNSWAFEVEGLEPGTYGFYNNDGDSPCTGEILTFGIGESGDWDGDRVVTTGVENEVDVCELDEELTPITPAVLTGTLRKGSKPRRH
jgi:hypothetical protein